MKLTDLPNIGKVIASEFIESRNQYEGGFAMFAMRPLDDKEHKKRHTYYLRKSRIASRYAKKNLNCLLPMLKNDLSLV